MEQGSVEQLGPCRLLRELGAGGMATVFLGELLEDRPYAVRGSRVAIKVLHPQLLASDESVRRFQREAELGSRVLHPCVVRTFEAGQADAASGPANFLILEYVEGRTLRSLIKEMGVVPEALLRDIALQITNGLQAVHAAGATHRDLKPDNVLITPDHQVKVMDLGIAQVATHTTRLTRPGFILGTLLYASPEQFEGAAVGPASDLYSLGVVLYEAATGRPPFPAESYAALAWHHLEREPERPRAVNPAITPFLEAVIIRLLEKKPADRFASAAELATVLERAEASDWWRLRESTETPGTARARPRVPVSRAMAFVGRAEELLVLTSAYERMTAGQGSVVILDGEAGVGKTRLLDEFVSRLEAEAADVDVLYGAYHPGGYGPGADALSQAVVGRFGAAALEQRLDGILPEAAQLIPAFGAHVLGRPVPSRAQALSAEGLHGLYCALMGALARRRPTIWIVEDVQFATDDGRAIILSLARQLGAVRVLLVLTSGPGVATEFISTVLKLPAAQHLPLDRLDTDKVIELVLQRVGRHSVAEALGERLAARTGGNAFFVTEAIRDLEERGLLKLAATRPTLSHASLARLTIPVSVRELLVRRLNEVPESDRALLDVAAVLGFEFDPDLVARVLDTKRLKVLQALAALERRTGLVRSAGPRFRFDHHQLQDVLQESLPASLREEYHALAAESYLRREALVETPAAEMPPQAAVFLANHYFRSNQSALRLDLAIPALDQLKAEYRSGALLQLADVILERCPDADPAVRCDVEILRSDTLRLLGRRDEALEAAERAVGAAAAAADHARVARAKLWVGRHRTMGADFEGARSALSDALELARAAGDQITATRALADLGRLLVLMGRFEEARTHFEQQLATARGIGDRRIECEALALLSNLYLGLDQHDLAERRSEEQLAVSQLSGDRESRALALFNLGQVAIWKGDYGLARKQFEEQLAVSREIAYRSSETLAHLALSQVSFETGQLEQARTHAEQGTDLCDAWQFKPAVGHLKLRGGDVAWAEGDESAAATLYEEALSHFRAVRASQGIAEAAFSLGRLECGRDNREAARHVLAEAADLAARLKLSIPGLLPAAYLALLGDPPPHLPADAEAGRCSVLAELHLVLHVAGAPGDHLPRARELLGRMSAHLDNEEAQAFWTDYPVARLLTKLTAG